jgi:hypothetical protein
MSLGIHRAYAVGNFDDNFVLCVEVGDTRALLGSGHLTSVAHELAGSDGAVQIVSVVVSVLQ